MGVIIWSEKYWLNIYQDTEIQYLEVEKQTISIVNIVKNYFKVIRSLNCELEYKSAVGRKKNAHDLEVVVLSLTAEFMSTDSENALFKRDQ